MKISIITITDESRNLGIDLAKKLKEDPTIISVKVFNKKVKESLIKSFKEYDCIIGIMAMGIMVRNTCSLIKNKIEDPAILVMDDQAKNIISMLSGHIGGANEITLKIAGLTGAEPVITTATDIHGKIGIDSLARKYYLSIVDYNNIKGINSALIQDKRVELYVPSKYGYISNDPIIRTSYNIHISSKNEFKAVYKEYVIHLKPKNLAVGIGARKNVNKNDVLNAIYVMMNLLELPAYRIDFLVTAEIKKDEKGIIESANELNLPLKIITIEEINSLNHLDCSSSVFVENKFGISGVCEPTALIAAGGGSRLIFKKTAFNGVTVAAAISSI